MRRKGFTLIELLVVIGIIFIFASIIAGGVGGCIGIMPNYSDGVREGIIIKASKKGMFAKSYEAQLQMSEFGLTKRGGGNISTGLGNVWEFSATDPAIGESVIPLIGRRVKVHYTQWWSKPWRQDSEYTVVKIEALDGPEPPKP